MPSFGNFLSTDTIPSYKNSNHRRASKDEGVKEDIKVAEDRPILPPLEHPIAIFPGFASREVESIKLVERMMSLSGDSFYIETVPDKKPLLQVQGDALSLSGRKRCFNTRGDHLFTIRKELFSIPRSYYAEDPEGTRFFDIEGKFSLKGSKAVGLFTYVNPKTGDKEEARLVMKGNFFDTKADIVDEKTGATVAVINRKFFNVRELIGGQQTYVVTIAPGMDMAMIAAMCICLDERRNEK